MHDVIPELRKSRASAIGVPNINEFMEKYAEKAEKKILENEVENALVQKLGGRRQVSCANGIADLVTQDSIIEIKIEGKWRDAIGQLLHYSLCFPGKKMVLVLFCRVKGQDVAITNLKIANEVANPLGITVRAFNFPAV